MSNFNRRSSLFISLKNPLFDEEKVIEAALTTPYDKVIKILNVIKMYLLDTNAKNILLKDLDWVIGRISTHKLYNYEISDQKKELDEITKNSHEVKSFFEYLNNFSENKDTAIRTNNAKCKTFRFEDSKITEIRSKLKDEEALASLQKSILRHSSSKNSRDLNSRKALTVNMGKPIKLIFPKRKNSDEIKKDIVVIDEIPSDSSSDKSVESVAELNFDNDVEDKYASYCSSAGDEDNSSNAQRNVFVFEPEVISIKHHDISEQIFSLDFNVFDLETSIGRQKVIPEGVKAIFSKLNLNKLISTEFFDNFLTNIRDGYQVTPYHNDLHGFDVCQTISQYIYQTDIDNHLRINGFDILSIVLSALMHDLGHPGYNNTYQVNSLSDIAITYNDRSVLENYHVSLGFKILKKPECNILAKLSLGEFKHARKRMIECILSTDMIFHSKIHSVVKNKLAANDIKYGVNMEKIVDKKSVNWFDDQQDVINFLIHTADVSHNSKEFKISSRWTDLLMEEFWIQGDKEKSMGYPVSFLCDRNTAEIPKSQIGFIKSIIIPTFEILVDMLPALNYFKENVYNNLDKWSDIVELENEKIDKDSEI